MKIKLNMFFIIILIITSVITVGFSAWNSQIIISDTQIVVRTDKNVRITSLIPNSEKTTNGGLSKAEDYDVDKIYADISLPNSNSTVAYELSVRNYGNVEVGISQISLPESLKDKIEIKSIDGYTLKDKIRDNENSCTKNNCKLSIERTFIITIGYINESVYDSTKTEFNNVILTFNFERAYNVELVDFENIEYLPIALENTTYEINIEEDTIDVTMSGIKIDNYTLENGVLKIPDVSGDITIEKLKKVIITLDANGGSVSPTEVEVEINTTYENLPTPTKEGYIFKGWYIGTTEINNGDTVKITSNATATAQYIKSEFVYTGSYQEFIVPRTGYYKFELWGASGGNDNEENTGYGAYASGYVNLNRNQKIYIYVGGKGEKYDTSTIGGYNGGGNSTSVNGFSGNTGGGATDIRLFEILPTSEELAWNSTLGLNSRIMVAGGGGGAASVSLANSGLLGEDGTLGDNELYDNVGKGGKQTSGGETPTKHNLACYAYSNGTAGGFGYGGTGGGSAISNVEVGGGGGGGSGYYGGSGASGICNGNIAGGAGSSFISGYAGVNAITSSTSRTHTNNTLHYSNKYFIDADIKAGVNFGNGKAKITYIGNIYEKRNTKLNNVRYIKDCINGNSSNDENHWTELQAILNGINVAINKKVTGTSPQYNNTTYAYSNIVDGKIDNTTGSSGYGYTESIGLQCVTIDLENIYNLDEIAVWHYFRDVRSYNNHSLYVSSDNSNWVPLINSVSNILETSNGIRINAWD